MKLRKFCLSIAVLMATVGTPLAQARGISLLRDAEIEEFLDEYSRPIFRAAGLNEDSIQILLVADQSLNAFAGGRYMGVNSGLLTIAETPNQIEGVIAHEAGHLAGGHSVRTDAAIASASRPMLLSLILAAGAVAAGAPEAGIGILGLGQNIGTANFLKYSRGQESTADQSSITYLDRIGHSSKGATELWRNVRNSQIIRGRQINPYRQTHPLANDRLSALQQRAEVSPYYEVEDSPEEIERLRFIQAKIHGFLEEPHATLRRYPLSDQSDPAHYARAVAYYRTSQVEKALIEIRTLTEARPDNPYFHELEGQMLFEFGKVEESIEPHKKAIALKSDNALLRIGLGRALNAMDAPENFEEAVTEFKRALLLEPDNGFGWYELARAYGGLENDTMADLATAESRYHAGAKPDANAFARRAMAGLRKGTPEWRQAADIVLATQSQTGGAALPSGIDDDAPAPRQIPETPPSRPDVPDPTIPEENT